MQSRQCVTCLFSRHILFYLSVPSHSYKDFEGYISDIKTGNMGLNVCGTHLSPSFPPSAHDIVVVTFHLEKSPPQAAVTTPAPGPG